MNKKTTYVDIAKALIEADEGTGDVIENTIYAQVLEGLDGKVLGVGSSGASWVLRPAHLSAGIVGAYGIYMQVFITLTDSESEWLTERHDIRFRDDGFDITSMGWTYAKQPDEAENDIETRIVTVDACDSDMRDALVKAVIRELRANEIQLRKVAGDGMRE